jgi:hypothetical protein
VLREGASPGISLARELVNSVLKTWSSETVEDPALRGSESEGSAVAWFLNGVLEWWSAGVLCKIPSSTGEQECLRIAMDKSSLQYHNLR